MKKSKLIEVEKKLFSGDNSIEMWAEINNARTIVDLKEALYTICCKLQELESMIDKIERR